MGFFEAIGSAFKKAAEEVKQKEQEEQAEKDRLLVTPEQAQSQLENLSQSVFDFSEVYHVQRESGPLVMIDAHNAEIVSKDIEQINVLLTQAKKKHRLRIVEIPAQEYSPNGSYIEVEPLTKSGKIPKYPFLVKFGSFPSIDGAGDGIFGEIYYLSDGHVGKARVICWASRSIGYKIELGLIGTTLSVLRIEKLTSKGDVQVFNYRQGGGQ